MRMQLGFTLAIALLIPGISAAETTISQPITQIQYDVDDNHLWFVGAQKWGATSCPNATYIRVTNGILGLKELLAIGLAAKASGQSVKFEGNCFSSDYFNATYVYLD
jgi:hypothetical protein